TVSIYIVFFVCAPMLAIAQANQSRSSISDDSGKSTRVAVASNSGPPGSAVVIPIYFTPAAGAEIGSLKVEISFVSVNLKFSGVERGVSAKLPNLDFTSDVKEGKNAKGIETSTVSIHATLRPVAGRSKGILAGALAYLDLRISAKANAATI